MSVNVGTMDRAMRAVVGLFLLAYANGFGFQQTGANWVGWIGLLPLATAVFGFCPFYRSLGRSTAPQGQEQ